jgi:hypothetical protein
VYCILSYLVGRRAMASTVSCYLRGRAVTHAQPADCHGKPPQWDWWRDYRNCHATNVCLHQQRLTLYSGAQPAEAFGVPSGVLACNNWHGESLNASVVQGSPPGLHRWATCVSSAGHLTTPTLDAFSHSCANAWSQSAYRDQVVQRAGAPRGMPAEIKPCACDSPALQRKATLAPLKRLSVGSRAPVEGAHFARPLWARRPQQLLCA